MTGMKICIKCEAMYINPENEVCDCGGNLA